METIQEPTIAIIKETISLKERFREGTHLGALQNEVAGLIIRIEGLLRMQSMHTDLKALERPLEDYWIELDAFLETINETEAMLQ